MLMMWKLLFAPHRKSGGKGRAMTKICPCKLLISKDAKAFANARRGMDALREILREIMEDLKGVYPT
jgi:hypothetical protein